MKTRLLLATLLGGLALSACKREAAVPASDQGPIALSLSTNRIRIGDPVRVTLTARHEPGARLEVPDLNRGREIVLRQVTQPEQADPALTRYDITLTSLIPSNHVLSTNALTLIAPDGAVTTQAFPFASLEVRSLLVETNAALRPAKALAAWPDPRLRMALLIGIAFALVIGGIVLAIFLRTRRLRPLPPPPPPPPAHEWALAALAALRAKPYIAAGQAAPFYVELSGIVRRYLEHRFGLHAPERTTDEFIREAASSDALTAGQQQWVGAFLEQSDLVKFARHEPAAADMEAGCAAAERLVRETAAPRPASGVAP